MRKLKQAATRIVASFVRAFIATITATQIADLQNTRGWAGIATAAVIAGIAAALRTVESLLGPGGDF